MVKSNQVWQPGPTLTGAHEGGGGGGGVRGGGVGGGGGGGLKAFQIM